MIEIRPLGDATHTPRPVEVGKQGQALSKAQSTVLAWPVT